MKKSQLRQIIREEIKQNLEENKLIDFISEWFRDHEYIVIDKKIYNEIEKRLIRMGVSYRTDKWELLDNIDDVISSSELKKWEETGKIKWSK